MRKIIPFSLLLFFTTLSFSQAFNPVEWNHEAQKINDSEYDLGGTLYEAMEHRVSMKHHRCFSCFKFGSSCSEI